MTDEEIVESIKAKLNAALKDVSSLNRKSACDLISEGVHGISILQFLIARIRKDTAKEILQAIAECRTVRSDVRGKQYNRYELDQKDFENIADRFGVEVDDE